MKIPINISDITTSNVYERRRIVAIDMLRGQFRLFHNISLSLEQYSIKVGHFKLLRLQFLFFTGCYSGYAKSTDRSLLRISTKLITAGITALIVLTVMRHLSDTTYACVAFEYFADRYTPGIVRLADLAVIAYLVSVAVAKKEKLSDSKWISLPGRHSLQVLPFTVCLFYLYLPLQAKMNLNELWAQTDTELPFVSSLAIPAILPQHPVKNYHLVKNLGM